MKRREFLKKATLTTITGLTLGSSMLVSSCTNSKQKEEKVEATNIITRKSFEWKMVTTWPPNFPVFGESANFIAKWIEEMSEGRLKIHVYAGGELVPALQAFDAVGQGMVEMYNAPGK
ncbi:MAG: C4-dicarboxylate transporter, substrate-binding protein [Deferribacteraceae bacterium]|jgi:TRAP-type mannitol/chloroaromatic compound transport system substrate-binding protein|nr:C4-dicarboxylate transporter, substrate-binding protein [Deferribacteraceae bacterium]